jgi:hypothetical protein
LWRGSSGGIPATRALKSLLLNGWALPFEAVQDDW